MAHLEVRDGDNAEKHIKATGAGTLADPFILERMDTNSAAMLAALQAIQAAEEGALPDTAAGDLAAIAAALADASNATNQVTLITALGNLLTELQLKADLGEAQPVSGPLTNAELRAAVVPVSGTVTAEGPLTDTELRATAVPVSGPLTDGELRATALPISGNVGVDSVAIPSALYHGQTVVATAGTEVALATTQALTSGVTLKALSTNTGIVYVGANPVTATTGFELAAGEQIFLEVADLATIYIDASVSGEGVSFIGG